MDVWHNGRWMGETDAVTALNDRGFMLGEGLFETMKLKHGQIVRIKDHENRLQKSCAKLGLNPPSQSFDLSEITRQFVAKTQTQNACVRLSMSSGAGPRGLDRVGDIPSSIWVQFSTLPVKPTHISLATSTIRREPTSIAAQHKTLSYVDNTVARYQAKGMGADMALMLDSNGNLSGTDCGNLFWVKADQIYTPSLDCAVLPGTTRAAVVLKEHVQEGCFEPMVLADVDGVFVTNALIGAVRIGQIDGREMPSCSRRIAMISDVLD
jgi:branched-subunit amino acid aminotransferase/4-amino-4-deoxychorismate lyase